MWFHTTNELVIRESLSQYKLVEQKRTYRDATVSSTPKDKIDGSNGRFGTWTIALNNNLHLIDHKGYIGHRYPHRRWRGLEKDIPVNAFFEAFLSIPKHNKKNDRTLEKRKIKTYLRSLGIEHLPVISYEQREVVREGVSKSLGLPNLNDNWW